jgi:RNA polymerase sigma-70 factor (ECF subfamily)
MLLPSPIASEPDELALARRCAEGDRAAQQELYRSQRTHVHRTLYRVLGSNRHMEDLLQETFVSAFRSIGSFRGESSLGTWLAAIAARVCYRHLSRNEQRVAHLVPVADLPSPGAHPEQQASAREALRRLYVLLDRLAPKYRIAYALHVIEGRPIKEVSRIVHCTAIAAKTRIWRARQLVDERIRRDPPLAELLTGVEAR